MNLGNGALRLLVCGRNSALTDAIAEQLRRTDDQTGDASEWSAVPLVSTVVDCADGDDLARRVFAATTQVATAVIVIDDRGLTASDRSVLSILSVTRMPTVVVAVAVSDVDRFSAAAFATIAAECRLLAEKLQLQNLTAIPVPAASGAQITDRGAEFDWYRGPTIRQCLELAAKSLTEATRPLRLPVTAVEQTPTGTVVTGTNLSGVARLGARVCVLPGGGEATIATLETSVGEVQEARSGQDVRISLAGTFEVKRGGVLSAADERPEVADQFAADIVWFDVHHLLKGRPYKLRLGPQSAVAQITDIRHVINVDTLEHAAGRVVERNSVARCHLSISKPIVFDPYQVGGELGRFDLIERSDGTLVGGGLILHALRRAQNIHWQAIEVTSAQRAVLKSQRPCCLWFTGLSGSGKSTIASLLEKRLHGLGRHTYVLDGDNVRHGLNRDLGFTEADRVENIRRVAEVARLMVDAGLITIVSFISPFRSERQLARERLAGQEFLEIFVDAPLAVCEQRDPKGLYRKARSGALQNFTGISSPYEPPETADLRLDTSANAPEVLVETILDALIARGVIGAH